MMSLAEKDYPKYLCQAYYMKTGEKLNLKHPKNLNQKIQWLKIYDNIPIKTILTDKILVRDWIKEKIGEEYLKPVLWVGKNFDDIPFGELPDSFVIKCNHGCKWHMIIKDKTQFLENKLLFKVIKEKFDSWITQSFFGYSDFEIQYKYIKPQLFIEPLMRDNINEKGIEMGVWCANSEPFTEGIDIENSKDYVKKSLKLSKILCEGFKFVRVDWMMYNNHLYFAEMTFTPVSGYLPSEMLKEKFFKKLFKSLKLR